MARHLPSQPGDGWVVLVAFRLVGPFLSGEEVVGEEVRGKAELGIVDFLCRHHFRKEQMRGFCCERDSRLHPTHWGPMDLDLSSVSLCRS